jgi:D-alanyl-D-alanine carboxypeptidase
MRNRSRTITIDLRGIKFTVQVLVVLALFWGVVQTTVPLVRYAFGSANDQSATTIHNDAPENAPVEWALDTLAPASTTTDTLATLQGAVPATGKFIRVNTDAMTVGLYQDGELVNQFSIVQIPPTDSPDAIPEGGYSVMSKEAIKLSTLTLVRFPQYVRFDDRFALHGRPTQADGSAQSSGTTEGSILLEDADAAEVYSFAEKGVPLYVKKGAFDVLQGNNENLDVHTDGAVPATSARGYLVTDLETGQVYLEKERDAMFPIASITKFVTAAVASKIITHTDDIQTPNGEQYRLGDLYYPLILRSDNGVANALAAHVGTREFLAHMNTFAESIGMSHTRFADPSGLSPQNISTTQDLTLLAKYLYESAPFLLDISSEESMTITSSDGMRLTLENQNKLAADPHFRGGKLGFTDEAGQTSLAIFSIPVGTQVRPVSVAILGSNDWKQDTRTLLRWVLENTKTRY